MLIRLFVFLAFVCVPTLWQTTKTAELLVETAPQSSIYSSIDETYSSDKETQLALVQTSASPFARALTHGREQVRLVGEQAFMAFLLVFLLLCFIKSQEVQRQLLLTSFPQVQRIRNRCEYYIYGFRHIIR
ncbi:MAG: hypothetical protein RR386_02975 [Bacteroidaceae bacterium]